MANTPHEPTEKTNNLVKLCAINGTPYQEIANALGVSIPTLRKYYKKILATALAEANATVLARLFEHTKKHPAACMFWLKTKAGFRENGLPPTPEAPPAKWEWQDDE